MAVRFFPEAAATGPRTGKAFVGISLNNRTTESSGLLRQVFDWTKRHIGPFDLLVGDYLNRHNYAAFDHLSEGEALQKAMREGAQVAGRLEQLISKTRLGTVSIISAGTLYSDPTFPARLSSFERCYAENGSFRSLIDQGVDAFLARKYRNLRLDDRIRARCIAYQLEELAMFELLAAGGYRTLVYAGAQLPVVKAIVSDSLNGVSPGLEALTLVELRFLKDHTQ